MIFFLSAVAVVPATDIHLLLDQGSVGYLYHLQILLFNLQDASPLDLLDSGGVSYLVLLQIRLDNRHDTRDNNNNNGANDATHFTIITVLTIT